MGTDHYDVAVAGGGLVGSGFACALAAGGMRCAVVEAGVADDAPARGRRALSLAQSSQRILSGLGLWQQLRADSNPIKRIHISDQGQFGTLRLRAEDFGMDALGYLIDSHALAAALRARLRALALTEVLDAHRIEAVQLGTDHMQLRLRSAGRARELRCTLLVAADGRRSTVRTQLGIEAQTEDYRQSSILCDVSTEKPNPHTAYERFTRHGPVALLPKGARQAALVYTVHSDDSDRYLHMSDAEFAARLQDDFGPRLGQLRPTSERRAWPLQYLRARKQVARNLVLLGDAAHSIHPNAAQGLNLCLRDAAALAETLLGAKQQGTALNDPWLLQHYAARRGADQDRIIRFNRMVARLFYSPFPPARLLRNEIMLFLAHNRFARARLVALLSGLHGAQPALVRCA